MTEQEFRAAYPLIAGWIQLTLAGHSTAAKPITSFGFRRLPLYYDAKLLASSRAVVVAKAPIPPLSAMGLSRFSAFEHMDVRGITYLNTYFVRADHADDESLHFHEVVHVVQWMVLGPERFLALYADGLEKQGYRDSPLEVMAYDHEARFNSGTTPYSVEAEVQQQLQEYRYGHA